MDSANMEERTNAEIDLDADPVQQITPPDIQEKVDAPKQENPLDAEEAEEAKELAVLASDDDAAPTGAKEATKEKVELVLPEITTHARNKSEHLDTAEGTTSKKSKPIFQMEKTLTSFGGSSFGSTRLTKFNQIQEQQLRELEGQLSARDRKKLKISHELSKIILEQPLEMEAQDDERELALNPEQKERLGSTIQFDEDDRRSPIKRTVVGGAEKYKEYLRDREREAKIKEKLAKAFQKQQAMYAKTKKELELAAKSKHKKSFKKKNVLDELAKGMAPAESLISLAQSDSTIKNIIASPGSTNDKPTEFMLQYATKSNQRQIAAALKDSLQTKLIRKGRESIISSTVTDQEKQQQQRASPSPGILKSKPFKSSMGSDAYLEGLDDGPQQGSHVLDSYRSAGRVPQKIGLQFREARRSPLPTMPYTERIQMQKYEEENARIMRAYSKHQIHQLHWDRTADTIRQLRKNLVIRDCKEKDKIGSKLFNLKRNPASLRSLIEEQRAYESSALALEDARQLNKSKFGVPSAENMKGLQAVESLQQLGNVHIQSQDSKHFATYQNLETNQSHEQIDVDINRSSQEFIPAVNIRTDHLRSQNSSNLSSQPHLLEQLKQQNSQSLTSFYSTMNKDLRRHRRINSTTVEEPAKTFDTAGCHTKWLYGLRGCQMKHVPAMNQRTNPFMAIHSTEPVNRFERDFQMRDIGFTSRSGFNQLYDYAEHRKPVTQTNKNSLKKLAELTSKRASTKLDEQFMNAFNNTFNFHSRSFKLRQYSDSMHPAELPSLPNRNDPGRFHTLAQPAHRPPDLTHMLNQTLESINSQRSLERTQD